VKLKKTGETVQQRRRRKKLNLRGNVEKKRKTRDMGNSQKAGKCQKRDLGKPRNQDSQQKGEKLEKGKRKSRPIN